MMGRIHPRAEEHHFSENPTHRGVLRPFLTGFDVTNAFWRRRGPDQLACFYLKPEPFLSELIGLERELFVAYSPFPEFQARTVKLHDQVFAEDRTRLDPIGSIIVCDDPTTKAAVANYVLTDPERPPILGLSREDLASLHTADDLRSLFFSTLYARDLFGLESPLRSDTTFFGRDEVVSQLLDRFRSGQNSGLFGLRRIGKTSVLYALRRRAESGEIAGSTYLDVSNPAVYQGRWYALLQRVIREFAAPLDLQRAERSRIRALNVEYNEREAASHLKADVLRLAAHYPGNRLLLLLDEIEHITFGISPAPHWSADFLPLWQTMRSVHQDTQAQFGFVLAGVNPHILETDRVDSWDNPLFSTTKAFYLGPFDLPELRTMVRTVGKFMAMRVEEGLYQRLLDEYGGHPFLVRQACSHLSKKLKERPATLTGALFEQERSTISVSLEKNVRQILNVLAIWYPDEYELLRLLARGDRATFMAFAEDRATFTEHVEGYGLVRDARLDPKLRIGLVRAFLAKVPKTTAMNQVSTSEHEEVQAEVSRRRNAIERELRRVLHNGLQYSSGNKAASAALAALPENRRAVLQQYSYRDLWEQLYFNEVIAVLRNNWSAFDKFFSADRDQIMRMLEHINASRTDAHARSLDEEALGYLRICFRKFEEMLEV
jgi:Novel STAND NTPase 1